MQTFSLTPLFRSTVGFDRFNDLFESLMDGDDGSNGYQQISPLDANNQFEINVAKTNRAIILLPV